MSSFNSGPTIPTNRLNPLFGNFMLIRVIGEGGFGKTYLAQHSRLPKLLAAIKLLRQDYVLEGRAAFAAEADIISGLDHENILPLHDYGIHQDLHFPYLVMPFAKNGSLQDRHKKGEKLPLWTIISYVMKVN